MNWKRYRILRDSLSDVSETGEAKDEAKKKDPMVAEQEVDDQVYSSYSMYQMLKTSSAVFN
jgi:hypothetical protein